MPLHQGPLTFHITTEMCGYSCLPPLIQHRWRPVMPRVLGGRLGALLVTSGRNPKRDFPGRSIDSLTQRKEEWNVQPSGRLGRVKAPEPRAWVLNSAGTLSPSNSHLSVRLHFLLLQTGFLHTVGNKTALSVLASHIPASMPERQTLQREGSRESQ